MLSLEQVLPLFGNKKAQLADSLGISRQAINNWELGEPIPEKHELKIRHELVPNIEALLANNVTNGNVRGQADGFCGNR